MADNIADLNIGMKIKYNSKAASDNNTYFGEVQSLLNFNTAVGLADVVSISNQIRLDYNIPPAENLNYFTIRTDRSELIVGAQEWIMESSFFIISETDKITIEIFEVTDDDKISIVNILSSSGYPNVRII